MATLRDPRSLFVMVIFMTSLLFTHPYTSVVLGITIFGIVAGRIFFDWTAWSIGRPARLGPILLTYSIIVLAQSIFYSVLFATAASLAQQYLLTISRWDRFLLTRFDALSVTLLVSNPLPDGLIVFIAVAGALQILESKQRRAVALLLGASASLLAAIFLGRVARLPYLFPPRMYVFFGLIGLIPVGGITLTKYMHLESPPRVPPIGLGVRRSPPRWLESLS